MQRRRMAMLQELDAQLERARREASALAREGSVLAGRLSAAEEQGAAQAEELRRLRGEREDLLGRWERAAEAAATANARASVAQPPPASPGGYQGYGGGQGYEYGGYGEQQGAGMGYAGQQRQHRSEPAAVHEVKSEGGLSMVDRMHVCGYMTSRFAIVRSLNPSSLPIHTPPKQK